MYEQLKNLKEQIKNAHMEWVNLKTDGVTDKSAMEEAETVWPDFPEFSLENYCECYNDLAIHYCMTKSGEKSVTAIIYGNIRKDLGSNISGFMFDLCDLHELSANDELAIGVLDSKTIEDAKKETECWIKDGFLNVIGINRFEDIFPRYFDMTDMILQSKKEI